MNFSQWSFKKTFILLSVLSLIVGGASASRYFSVSNTLTDTIAVVMDNSKNILKLSYSPGKELGGENKLLKFGKLEEFQVTLINNSPPTTEPWENILIRIKIYGVEDENICVGYRYNGVWENAPVYDLRTLELGEIGGVADVGPEGGWTINPSSPSTFDLRMEIDEVCENLEVKINAIVKDIPEVHLGEVDSPESKRILIPLQDAYLRQDNPSAEFNDKDYLEVTTEENSNSYIILRFNRMNIPNSIRSVNLKLYQYWGSGFSDLQAHDVKMQIFPITQDLNENITWKTLPALGDMDPIAEEEVRGNRNWYNFDLTSYLSSLEHGKAVVFLLKFSQDNFDNRERRIRFDSTSGEYPPYLIFK